MSSQLSFVTGDVTLPQGDGLKIVAHCCNDIGAFGAGVALAIAMRWPSAKRQYVQWHREGNALLGSTQFVAVDTNTHVANMVGQHDIVWHNGIPPIRYDALRQCLSAVAARASEWGASVHMPRIGCLRAGGDWKTVGPIVMEDLSAKGVAVTVYELLGRP